MPDLVGRDERVGGREGLLSAIVEGSRLAIISMTTAGSITSWNSAAERLYGYGAEEMIGRHVCDLIPDGRREEAIATLTRIVAGEHVDGFPSERVRKDGHIASVCGAASPVRDETGDIVGVSVIDRDVVAEGESGRQGPPRDRADLERLVEQRTAAVAAMSRELEAFTFAVSHDLRAPLRSVDGFSQVLLEDCADRLDAEGRDYLGRIRAGARRMTDMLDGLLGLARVARVELRSERVDLSAIAVAVADDLRAAAPARAARIEIAASLVATGDARLLRIVLANLIGNAWKFTEREPLAEIEAGVHCVDGEQRFFVADNGVGFDMKAAAKLFSPFQRLHSVDEFSGTGIGLAAAQRIVDRHGGRIWAQGVVGAGATFSFTLSDPRRPSCIATRA